MNFTVRMFPVCGAKKEFWITLELDIEDLEEQAEIMQYPMKMMEHLLKFPFNRGQKNLFETFRSRDIQAIIFAIINKVINLKDLE
jgi:hypothetical protein